MEGKNFKYKFPYLTFPLSHRLVYPTAYLRSWHSNLQIPQLTFFDHKSWFLPSYAFHISVHHILPNQLLNLKIKSSLVLLYAFLHHIQSISRSSWVTLHSQSQNCLLQFNSSTLSRPPFSPTYLWDRDA